MTKVTKTPTAKNGNTPKQPKINEAANKELLARLEKTVFNTVADFQSQDAIQGGIASLPFIMQCAIESPSFAAGAGHYRAKLFADYQGIIGMLDCLEQVFSRFEALGIKIVDAE